MALRLTSGRVALGQEHVRKVVTGDVIKQAAEARRAVKAR